MAEIWGGGGEGAGPRFEEVAHCGEEGSGVLTGVRKDGGEVCRLGGGEGVFVGSEVEFVGLMVDCE